MAKIVFKFLEDVSNVNDFYEIDELELISGEAKTLYFQLVKVRASDLDDRLSDIRYIPEAGATINVKFQALDSNKAIERPATLVFSNDDRSIWKVDILATDKISSGSMKISLTEGSSTKLIFPGKASKLSVKSDSGSYYC